jgi:iron complex transport system ATP-binding protein
MADARASLAIAVRGAGHWYQRDRWVFRGLDIEVQRGRTLCILGPNGRGKTTLLRAVAGLLDLWAGRVSVNGAVAFVPQLYQTVFAYSVREMVVMGRARHVGLIGRPSRRDYALAEAMLARVGLAGFAGRTFNALSGGERQLVLLARALAAEGDVLVLDEPSSALDLRNQSLLLKLLAEIAAERGIAVVYSTHHPQHALAADCDVLLMLDAERHLTGPASRVLDEANLTALYGVPVRRVEVQYASGHHAGLVPLYFAP